MRPLRVGDNHRETLGLALVVWLCSTPLVLLFTVPFLGWKATTTVVIAWLVAVLALCFAVCLWRLPRFRTFPMAIHAVSRLRRASATAPFAPNEVRRRHHGTWIRKRR